MLRLVSAPHHVVLLTARSGEHPLCQRPARRDKLPNGQAIRNLSLALEPITGQADRAKGMQIYMPKDVNLARRKGTQWHIESLWWIDIGRQNKLGFSHNGFLAGR